MRHADQQALKAIGRRGDCAVCGQPVKPVLNNPRLVFCDACDTDYDCCPSCGMDALHPNAPMNPLSRTNSEAICERCGMQEAFDDLQGARS